MCQGTRSSNAILSKILGGVGVRAAPTRLNGRVIVTPNPTLVAALHADLASCNYSSEAIRQAWGEQADAAFGAGVHAPALRELGERTDPLATLARLFVLGVPQSANHVADALPTLGLTHAQSLGIVAQTGDVVKPLVHIRPQSYVDASGVGEWWVASDLDEAALGGPLPDDHVLGVGGASLTLAGLQLGTPAARVLDLGTGCGVQALRARRYANEVVATDVSTSALQFTQFNALLNQLDGIEVREGSLYEPVAGEQFDRIVSNPPFVITPRGEGVPVYEYRDGGRQGDDLVAEVVRGAGEHLVPGGVAQLLGNWEYHEGLDGMDRVRSWVASSPVALDAWVIEREQLSPVQYASLWIRDGGTVPGSAEYNALMDAWLADFAARGVRSVGFGYILLRRSHGTPTLSRYERVGTAVPAEGTLGAHFAEALAAHDALQQLGTQGLLEAKLIVAPDVTEARHHMPGQEDPMVIELRQGAGFGRSLSVDPALAALVGASDGDLTVGQISDAVAQLMEVDEAELRADLLPRVQQLLVDGFLRLS